MEWREGTQCPGPMTPVVTITPLRIKAMRLAVEYTAFALVEDELSAMISEAEAMGLKEE